MWMSSSSMLIAATGRCWCLQVWIREFAMQHGWRSFPLRICGRWTLFRLTPGLEEGTYDSSGFSARGILICICCIPLQDTQGVSEGGREINTVPFLLICICCIPLQGTQEVSDSGREINAVPFLLICICCIPLQDTQGVSDGGKEISTVPLIPANSLKPLHTIFRQQQQWQQQLSKQRSALDIWWNKLIQWRWCSSELSVTFCQPQWTAICPFDWAPTFCQPQWTAICPSDRARTFCRPQRTAICPSDRAPTFYQPQWTAICPSDRALAFCQPQWTAICPSHWEPTFCQPCLPQGLYQNYQEVFHKWSGSFPLFSRIA